jgi:hypothetical protein
MIWGVSTGSSCVRPAPFSPTAQLWRPRSATGSRSTVAPAMDLAGVAAVIAREALEPPRMRRAGLRIVALGFGFSRRQLAAGDGSVGPGCSPASSSTSSQWPSLPFDITPRAASPRRRSAVLERFAPAAFANALTLEPALPCRAAKNLFSAVRGLDALLCRDFVRRGGR